VLPFHPVEKRDPAAHGCINRVESPSLISLPLRGERSDERRSLENQWESGYESYFGVWRQAMLV
jgi:hypothetical protein